MFRGVLLDGEAATLASVETALNHVDILHFACHAESVPTQPISSALLLAEGSRLKGAV
jgi:CHAT domain-containing protein